jgi:hypothetical protein
MKVNRLVAEGTHAMSNSKFMNTQDQSLPSLSRRNVQFVQAHPNACISMSMISSTVLHPTVVLHPPPWEWDVGSIR